MIKNRYGMDVEIPVDKCSLNRYGIKMCNCPDEPIRKSFIEEIIAKIIKYISK
jgi:hypothetical protein